VVAVVAAVEVEAAVAVEAEAGVDSAAEPVLGWEMRSR
jgi:hypothetical protein